MMTKWDKIAFVLIAALLVLAIVFRHDLSDAFTRKETTGGKDDKKGKKEMKKDADKKQGSRSLHVPPASLALWPRTPQPIAFSQHASTIISFNLSSS